MSRAVCEHGKLATGKCEDCEELGRMWREEIAERVIGHIDTMYPAMWQNVPKTARTSIRNTIINTLAGD